MTVTFAGKDGGRFPEAADYCFIVPSYSIYRIQEVHATAVHIVWDIVHIALGEEEDRGSKPLEGRRVVRFDLSWFISEDCALRSLQEVRPAIEHRLRVRSSEALQQKVAAQENHIKLDVSI
jgi:hypothetical protein